MAVEITVTIATQVQYMILIKMTLSGGSFILTARKLTFKLTLFFCIVILLLWLQSRLLPEPKAKLSGTTPSYIHTV